MTLATVVQLIAVVTGLVSVYYWWRSATLKVVEAPAAAGMPKGGPGDQVFETEEGKFLHWRISEQSKLNAKAAAWTGVTTLLQALSLIAGICCAH
jgi:hypothetical protein